MPVTIVEIKEEVMKLVEEEDIPSLQRYMTYLRMIDKKRERSYNFRVQAFTAIDAIDGAIRELKAGIPEFAKVYVEAIGKYATPEVAQEIFPSIDEILKD